LIATVLLTCTLLSPITPNDINQYWDCKERNEIIYDMKKYINLFSMYFKEEDLEKAIRITWCESKGKIKAIGVNKDGTKDVGLWQFNDNTWAWLTPKLNITANRFNAHVSTAVASWLVYNDGWHHWNSSKHCWNIPNQ
jgi:hypothetical protein